MMGDFSDEIMQEAANLALKQWDLSVSNVTMFSRTENVVFRVETVEGDCFALRIHRDSYHSLDELNSEPLWTVALNEFGIASPKQVLTRSNENYAELIIPGSDAVRYAGLIEWFPGRTMEDIIQSADDRTLTADCFRQLGSLMATMHNQSSAWIVPVGFKRHAFDVDGFLGSEPFWGRYWEISELSNAQKTLLSDARDWLKDWLEVYPKTKDNFSMIHADLRTANVLVHEGTVSIIDFDDAGFGWHIYDIAVALSDASLGSDFDVLKDALVEGYREVRQLGDSELEALDLFILLRALASLGWLHDRPEVEYYAFLPMLIEHACAAATELMA